MRGKRIERERERDGSREVEASLARTRTRTRTIEKRKRSEREGKKEEAREGGLLPLSAGSKRSMYIVARSPPAQPTDPGEVKECFWPWLSLRDSSILYSVVVGGVLSYIYYIFFFVPLYISTERFFSCSFVPIISVLCDYYYYYCEGGNLEDVYHIFLKNKLFIREKKNIICNFIQQE